MCSRRRFSRVFSFEREGFCSVFFFRRRRWYRPAGAFRAKRVTPNPRRSRSFLLISISSDCVRAHLRLADVGCCPRVLCWPACARRIGTGSCAAAMADGAPSLPTPALRSRVRTPRRARARASPSLARFIPPRRVGASRSRIRVFSTPGTPAFRRNHRGDAPRARLPRAAAPDPLPPPRTDPPRSSQARDRRGEASSPRAWVPPRRRPRGPLPPPATGAADPAPPPTAPRTWPRPSRPSATPRDPSRRGSGASARRTRRSARARAGASTRSGRRTRTTTTTRGWGASEEISAEERDGSSGAASPRTPRSSSRVSSSSPRASP